MGWGQLSCWLDWQSDLLALLPSGASGDDPDGPACTGWPEAYFSFDSPAGRKTPWVRVIEGHGPFWVW